METNKHTLYNSHAIALIPYAMGGELAAYSAAYSTPPGKVNGKLLKDDFAFALKIRSYLINNCPKPSDLNNVVALVPDPIQNFVYHVSRYGLDVNKAIEYLKNEREYSLGYNLSGIVPLRQYLGETNVLFKYESDVEEFLTYVGIDSLTDLRAEVELITLTSDQLDEVTECLGDDISIYNSITSPGTTFVNTSNPEPEETEQPFILTKLSVRRKLRELGLETKLDQFLNSNPQAKSDWNDATQLSSDDPVMINGISAFSLASGLSEQQVKDILRSVN